MLGRYYEDLQQAYRVALMGLGGRSISLTESERVTDPRPYLASIRAEFLDVQQLAADASRALAVSDGDLSLASDWEMEGAGNLEPRWIRPERYSLNLFTVRLVELARDPMPVLDLGGRAQQMLDWFEANVEGLERHVELDPEASFEERRELAAGAIRAAVQQDEVAADEEMIGRELSADRVAAFTTGVYAAAFTRNIVERLFERAGASLYLAAAADDAPTPRGPREYVAKGFLAVEPENARRHYAPFDGDHWGGGEAGYVTQRLIELIDESPAIAAPLDSAEEVLRAIDSALDDLAPFGGGIVLLEGDWARVFTDLATDRPDGYESWWTAGYSGWEGTQRRYRENPIVWIPTGGERKVYVVEPGAWGCFVRAQVEGDTDLRVGVESISEERAREMLSARPDLLSDVPDPETKLRKLQTFVIIEIAGRTGFRVTNPDRARKVVQPAGE